jgi:hypothetical protein
MKGRSIPLSPARRLMADLSWLANRVPQGVLRRRIAIADVRAARASAATRVPWTVIFAKAYALAARDCPSLRRTYATIPWPHLYETEQSVASIIIEREWDGEPGLVPARIKNPEDKPLAAITAEVEAARLTPMAAHKPFRSMLRTNLLPWPLRRVLWWIAFNAGPQRHKFFGTFGLTALGHRGLSINYPVSPVTTVLTIGPFEAADVVEITIGFDHRTMDGAAVADAFDALERHLATTLASELRMQGRQA